MTIPVANPYAVRRPFLGSINQENNMGRQSQHRVANQIKRKYKLCSNNNKNKRQKGDQLTLEGAVAFDSDRDCTVCKAKNIRKFLPTYSVPHRGHHQLCVHNKSTKGAGPLTSQGVANLADDKRYKQLTRPTQPGERMSGSHLKKGGRRIF